MDIEKFIVLDKEVVLPNAISQEDALDRWNSILNEINPELAGSVDGESVGVRVDGNTLVVYRTDAIHG